MDRNIQRIGSINVATMFLIGLFSWFTANYAQAMSTVAASVYMTLGFLVCCVSWFQMRLEARERLEKMEFDEMSKAKDSSALFSSDGESFEAKRSREQFDKYVVPAFTIFLFIAEVIAVWALWRGIEGEPKEANTGRAIVTAAFYSGFFLVLFLMGQYSASLARLENQRLIRPGGSFMLLSSFVSLVVAVVEAATFFGFEKGDMVVARVLSVVLGLIAAETLLALMFEAYRPRLKDKEVHLLYDSRLVGLLGQPGGIFSTVAQAIDYQFGFKVSETWFYRFLERALVWIVLLQLGALAASTMLVIVKPHEQALIERFGKPARGGAVIQPGLHFKLPWPLEKIYRHNPGQIQKINVGFVPSDHESNEPVLWTNQHNEEEYNFLVASREQLDGSSVNTNAAKAVPVNLITASIPVHFMIEDLEAWEYGHADGAALLQSMATREVVRYCVNVDVVDLMTSGRLEAAKELHRRIQERADEMLLGVRIVFVGLQDIHPPMGTENSNVAAVYEDVNNAIQERETTILMAKTVAAEAVPAAHAEAARRVSEAEGYRLSRVMEASSVAARFTNQITAFNAAPEVFSKRTHMNALADATRKARKYVVAVTNTKDVVTLNLEDKIHTDLTDINVEVPNDDKK